jgi:peptidoglycan-associated lipoprotein
MRLPRSLRFPLLIALFPVLFAGKCKKKDPEIVDTTPTDVNTPEVKLQVVSIEPAEVEPDSAFRGIVYGSGFQSGARVWLGSTEVASVTFRDENTLALSAPPLSEGSYDVKVLNGDGEKAMLRGGLSVRGRTDAAAGLNCGLIRVRFDFDKSSITTDSDRELTRNLPCFTSRSGQVRIEGHCDERGTTEYNIALGQRRGDAVNKGLVGHGVPPSRLRTVSYGEERPVDPGHSEAAWSQNRRADVSAQ